MLASQIFSSAALPGPLPIASAKSGSTYSLFGIPTVAAAAAVAPVSSLLIYTPIFVPFKISASQIGAFFAGSPSSGSYRFALYAVGSDGLPGALVYDFGYNNSTYNTLSGAASSPPALTRGYYYMALNPGSTSPSLYGYAPSAVPSLLGAGLLPVVNDNANVPAFLNARPMSFGNVFPTPASAPTTSHANLLITQIVAA